MMLLEAGEACKLAPNCPYHTGNMGPCYGARGDRSNIFECEHVVNGRIVEGGSITPGDKTGKMRVIME